MMRYFTLLIVITLGCVSKHNFAGKHFKSSDSLCLDALVVNMAADGCKNIVAEEDEAKKILKIYCNDAKVDGNSPWLNHFFYFASTQSIDMINLPGILMCVDPSLSMSYDQ